MGVEQRKHYNYCICINEPRPVGPPRSASIDIDNLLERQSSRSSLLISSEIHILISIGFFFFFFIFIFLASIIIAVNL